MMIAMQLKERQWSDPSKAPVFRISIAIEIRIFVDVTVFSRNYL